MVLTQRREMETSFCDEGHEICWAQVNGKRTAMVAVGPAFCLDEGLNATPIGPCFVLHAQMCGSKRFMPVRKLLLEMQEERSGRGARSERRSLDKRIRGPARRKRDRWERECEEEASPFQFIEVKSHK